MTPNPSQEIFNHNVAEALKTPGQGWTNGDMAPQFFTKTQAGRVQLYSNQRRWIGLKSGWTRIGEGTTELDARHSQSTAAGPDLHVCHESQGQAVRALISQLCERFYQMGWATGTGGGVSIRVGGDKEGQPWRVFVAPSGIQKEDMIGEDIYELVSREFVIFFRLRRTRDGSPSLIVRSCPFDDGLPCVFCILVF